MDAERKQKVALAAWIPLQFVVFIIASLLNSALVKVLRTPDMDYWGFRSSLIYSTGALATLTMAALGVTIIGMVIIYRHQYGSRKTLKHFGIWYAVYLVLTAVVFCIEGSRWDVMGEPPVVACLVVTCIYPMMSYLVLKLIVAVSRGEITMEKRVGIAGWIPLQVLMYILYIYVIIMPIDSLSRSLGIDMFKHEVVEVVYDPLVCAVALIGWWLFLRYDYGSRKYWRCCIIGYVVIAVFALVYVVCLASDLRALHNGGIVMAALCILLYPVISMLGLRLVIGIARINRENEMKQIYETNCISNCLHHPADGLRPKQR